MYVLRCGSFNFAKRGFLEIMRKSLEQNWMLWFIFFGMLIPNVLHLKFYMNLTVIGVLTYFSYFATLKVFSWKEK